MKQSPGHYHSIPPLTHSTAKRRDSSSLAPSPTFAFTHNYFWYKNNYYLHCLGVAMEAILLLAWLKLSWYSGRSQLILRIGTWDFFFINNLFMISFGKEQNWIHVIFWNILIVIIIIYNYLTKLVVSIFLILNMEIWDSPEIYGIF